MSLLEHKKDRYGRDIEIGSVCAWSHNGKVELVIYEKSAWGGENTAGEFGRFITADQTRSIKYSSVVFVFDPIKDSRTTAPIVKELMEKYYEGKKR